MLIDVYRMSKSVDAQAKKHKNCNRICFSFSRQLEPKANIVDRRNRIDGRCYPTVIKRFQRKETIIICYYLYIFILKVIFVSIDAAARDQGTRRVTGSTRCGLVQYSSSAVNKA